MKYLNIVRDLWASTPEAIKIFLKFWGIGIGIILGCMAVIYLFIGIYSIFGEGFTIFMGCSAVAGFLAWGFTKI